MLNEKDTIRCESVFNDDRTHRFLWKRVWDSKDKPIACVIMLNPCIADNIITDTTTGLVCNNIARLEKYGGVIIVNLFSLLTSKLSFRWNSDEDLNDSENDSYIKKAALESDIIILAWGKSADSNQRIAARAEHVVAMLAEHRDKMMIITDGDKKMIHPLTPSCRSYWDLLPFDSMAEEAECTTAEEPHEENTDTESAPA